MQEWQPAPAATGDAAHAEAVARQVAAFLAEMVRGEVDDAHIGPLRVLMTGDGRRVFAGAVVTGPLRVYVATASGAAGQAAHKSIVSYTDATRAREALDATLAHQTKQGYSLIGTIQGDA